MYCLEGSHFSLKITERITPIICLVMTSRFHRLVDKGVISILVVIVGWFIEGVRIFQFCKSTLQVSLVNILDRNQKFVKSFSEGLRHKKE